MPHGLSGVQRQYQPHRRNLWQLHLLLDRVV
jgi:hypothetical protein